MTKGPLHDPVTWHKITHAGTQVAQWDFQKKAGQGGLVRVALFWKFHFASCVPECVILYHVTGSCKGPIIVFVVSNFDLVLHSGNHLASNGSVPVLINQITSYQVYL